MNNILEWKTKIVGLVEKNESLAKAIARFLIMLAAYLLVYINLGYNSRIHIIVFPVILTILCTILPFSMGLPVLGGYVLLNLYGLGIEVMAIAAALMVLCYLLFLRFSPKKHFLVALTPVLWCFRIPYVAPIAVGLKSQPANGVATLMGTVLFFFLKGIRDNDSLFLAAEGSNSTSKLSVALAQLTGNTEMWVVLIAFMLTTSIVYIIRRKSIRNAWRIAIYCGFAVQVVVILGGKLIMGNFSGMIGFVIGAIVSVFLAIGFEFVMFHLDYTRVERTQFEDDYYYYYVKAVPKVLVKGQEKKVTTFGTSKAETVRKQDEEAKDKLAKELEIDPELLK